MNFKIKLKQFLNKMLNYCKKIKDFQKDYIKRKLNLKPSRINFRHSKARSQLIYNNLSMKRKN